MDNENSVELKNKIESRLLQKIGDLEAVKASLEEDVRTSSGVEREKSLNLLKATSDLLSQLKQAQQNIHDLKE